MMSNSNEHFQFTDERFADLQMLRYRLNGFEDLTLSQQIYIYCLAKEIELLMTSRLSRFTSREFGSPAASTTIMVVKNSSRVFPSISSMRLFL